VWVGVGVDMGEGATGDGSAVSGVPDGGVVPNTLYPESGAPWEWWTRHLYKPNGNSDPLFSVAKNKIGFIFPYWLYTFRI